MASYEGAAQVRLAGSPEFLAEVSLQSIEPEHDDPVGTGWVGTLVAHAPDSLLDRVGQSLVLVLDSGAAGEALVVGVTPTKAGQAVELRGVGPEPF